MSRKSLMNWVRLLIVLVCFELPAMIVLELSPAKAPSDGLLSELISAVAVITAFTGLPLLVIYPLMVRADRALQPHQTKNQVAALMNLSKDPNWDGNDMGRRLSRILAWNRPHGEQIVRGVILAGFLTDVLPVS